MLGGFAYVAETDRVILIVNLFRDNLLSALELTAKALPRLDEDDRMIPILNSLAKQHISKEYAPSGDGTAITHDQVASLEAHFAPCMQNLSQALKRDSHLKHTGRLHFGLFLKGIGMSLDESMLFWKMSFNKMNEDEFNKKGYPYNIRYNYGMEGKRTNYTPYSCLRIISGLPGPGDSHGCPFKHFSEDNLTSMMHRLNVNDHDILDISKRAKQNHYQLACTRLFEVTRGKVHAEAENARKTEEVIQETIEHPNQWFDLSRNGISKIKKEAIQ